MPNMHSMTYSDQYYLGAIISL